MPERVQLRRTKGWRKPEGAIVVARPSKWGNPFRIWNGHHLIGPTWALARENWTHIPAEHCTSVYVSSSRPLTNADAVAQFAVLMRVRQRDEPQRLADWLAPLAGHDLACWCPLTDERGLRVPCHADVLLEIANSA